MWRITLKGVVANRLRYALTALAVLLGVAFIAGTFVLTDTMNSAFNGLYTQIYQGTAAVVRATQPFSPRHELQQPAPADRRQPREHGSQGAGRASGGARHRGLRRSSSGKNGKPIGMASNGPPTLGVAWTDVTALNPLRLLPGGQPPRGPGQVVIDKHSADVGGFTVGDKVRVLTKQGSGMYTITGIAMWGSADSPMGATITAFDKNHSPAPQAYTTNQGIELGCQSAN